MGADMGSLASDLEAQQRDDFIAKRIRDTLGDGETGILFIGANHDVLSRLPNDFELIEVKVSKYHPKLISGTRFIEADSCRYPRA